MKPLLLLLSIFVCLFILCSARIPPSNQELWTRLNVTIAEQCRANGVYYYSDWYQDPMLYMTPEPVRTPYVRIYRGQSTNPDRATVICGMSARGFITTDVCVKMIEDICSGGGQQDTLYTFVPYANPRGRDLVHRLYGVFRGVAQPYEYWQQRDALPEWFKLAMQSLLPTNHANRDIYCLDGTPRMTLLRNNFPKGWEERGVFDVVMSGMAQDIDPVSDHGTIPLSDPEARILEKIIQFSRPRTLIDIETGQPAISVPYEGGRLAFQSQSEARISLSLQNARLTAHHLCKECMVDYGASHLKTAQSGTLGDMAIQMNFARTAYTLQIINRDYTPSVQNKVDCLRRIMPDTDEGIDEVSTRWAAIADELIHRGGRNK